MDFLRISIDFLRDFNGFAKDFNGFPLDFNGFPLDFNGFPWVSMDFQLASQPSQPASQQATCLTKCQAARRLKVSKQWLAGWLLGWLDWRSGQSTSPCWQKGPKENKKQGHLEKLKLPF